MGKDNSKPENEKLQKAITKVQEAIEATNEVIRILHRQHLKEEEKEDILYLKKQILSSYMEGIFEVNDNLVTTDKRVKFDAKECLAYEERCEIRNIFHKYGKRYPYPDEGCNKASKYAEGKLKDIILKACKELSEDTGFVFTCKSMEVDLRNAEGYWYCYAVINMQ